MYNTIILGSGYYSAGYALGHENSIIIEKSQLCDINFYGTYSGFCQTEYEPVSQEGKEMKDYFNSLGILRDTKINVNTLESVFCSFIKNKPIKILLNTECISVTQAQGVYCVEIYNNAGLDRLYAKKVIDTRAKNKNQLNVLLELDSEGYALFSKKYKVLRAFYEDEYIISYKTDKDVNTAKLDFYNEWKNTAKLKNSRIISFAYQLSGKNVDLSLGNMFKAFDLGMQGAEYENL